MASFQKDIGTPQFPFVNFPVPQADTTRAQQVKLVGTLAREAYKGKVHADLKGGEKEYAIEKDRRLAQDNQIIPLEEGGPVQNSDYTEIEEDDDEEDETVFKAARGYTGLDQKQAYDEAIADPDLNLRKIAAMRSQGRLTATGAKALANKSVQSASARLPGKAAEFRQKAAAFFGDFGEAGGLLRNTAAEDLQAKQEAKLKLDAQGKGYYSVDEASGTLIQTTKDLLDYQHYQRSKRMWEVESSGYDIQIKRGVVTAGTILPQKSNAIFDANMAHGIGVFSSYLSSGKPLSPLQINTGVNEIQNAARKAGEELNEWADRVRIEYGTHIPQERIDAQINAMNKRAEIAMTMMKDGSLEKLSTSTKATMSNLISIYGYKLFPKIALAKSVGGESQVTFMLEKIDQLRNMDEATLARRLQIDPDLAGQYTTQQMLDSVDTGMSNMIEGITSDDPLVNAISLTFAKHTIANKEATPAQRSTAKERLFANRNKGPQVLSAYSQPEAIALSTPEDQEDMAQIVAQETNDAIDILSNELANDDSLKLKFFPNNPNNPYSLKNYNKDGKVIADHHGGGKRSHIALNETFKMHKGYLPTKAFRNKIGKESTKAYFEDINQRIEKKKQAALLQRKRAGEEKAGFETATEIRKIMQDPHGYNITRPKGAPSARDLLIEKGYTFDNIDPEYKDALLEVGQSYDYITKDGKKETGVWTLNGFKLSDQSILRTQDAGVTEIKRSK